MARARGIEATCEHLVSEVRRAWPRHYKQGSRRPPLVSGSDAPMVRFVTDHRIKGVSEDAARGIAAWSLGLEVEVFERVPEPLEVLRLQARGSRCVSVLSAGSSSAPHASALDFLLHDLCHIGKFADPRHHREQVGFFATFARALDHPGWRALEAELDAEWIAARDQVLCDMNGASIFLFAAFKMKLKMAARRKAARQSGRTPAVQGPLDAIEEGQYRELLARALAFLGFEAGPLRSAAITTSARRDCPKAAALIADYFRGMGADVLEAKRATPGAPASAAERSPRPR